MHRSAVLTLVCGVVGCGGSSDAGGDGATDDIGTNDLGGDVSSADTRDGTSAETETDAETETGADADPLVHGRSRRSRVGRFRRRLSARPSSSIDLRAFAAPPRPVVLVIEDFSGISGTVRQATLVPMSSVEGAAYRDAILAADSGARVRDASRDPTSSTCTGGSESVQAYTLGAGRTFDFVDGSGAIVRSVSGATLFVKTSSPKACGGIRTSTVPAAQVAASFFVDMGAMVFDPYSSPVCVPR